jgi:hypothetical protein
MFHFRNENGFVYLTLATGIKRQGMHHDFAGHARILLTYERQSMIIQDHRLSENWQTQYQAD